MRTVESPSPPLAPSRYTAIGQTNFPSSGFINKIAAAVVVVGMDAQPAGTPPWDIIVVSSDPTIFTDLIHIPTGGIVSLPRRVLVLQNELFKLQTNGADTTFQARMIACLTLEDALAIL